MPLWGRHKESNDGRSVSAQSEGALRQGPRASPSIFGALPASALTRLSRFPKPLGRTGQEMAEMAGGCAGRAGAIFTLPRSPWEHPQPKPELDTGRVVLVTPPPEKWALDVDRPAASK